MAINISTITKLISDFRALSQKDSISPESLGVLLQKITDLFNSAASDEILNKTLKQATDALSKAKEAYDAAVDALSTASKAAEDAALKAVEAADLAAEAEKAADKAGNAAAIEAEKLKKYIGIFEIKAYTYHQSEYLSPVHGDVVWSIADGLFYELGEDMQWSVNSIFNTNDANGNTVPRTDVLFRLKNCMYMAHLDENSNKYVLDALVDTNLLVNTEKDAITKAKASRGVINMHTEFYDEIGPITRGYTLSDMIALLDAHSRNGEYCIPSIIIIYNDSDAGAVVSYAWKGAVVQTRDDWFDTANWQRLW